MVAAIGFWQILRYFLLSDPLQYQRIVGKYSGECIAKLIGFQSGIRK